jgi:integrase
MAETALPNTEAITSQYRTIRSTNRELTNSLGLFQAAFNDLLPGRCWSRPRSAPNERITQTAPESLDENEQRRFIRACGRCGSARNAAIALLLLYTGLRIEEVEAVDIDDVVSSEPSYRATTWTSSSWPTSWDMRR